MSAATSPPDLPPPPPPSGQWAYPTNEQGEPKKRYVLWVVLGAAGCFVAIVVVGLLATILVPNILRSLSRAQQAKAQSQIEMLCGLLEAYKESHAGQYPAALEALERPELLRDPWDRAYLYEPPTAERDWPDVFSLGHDGLPGGRGADEDIHSISSLRGHR
jgi:general secretion pathway protein G